jgi:DNA polymerase
MQLPVSVPTPQLTKQEINQMIEDLDTCPLKNSGVKVVHPVGDGSSKIMFIGEAPGYHEDRLGEPFVGASGKFLNQELLPSIGLSRRNIYLTNIVKCRPPKNRDPKDEEKEAWNGILLAEIAWQRPHLIVCLGRHALSFFSRQKVGRSHGTVQSLPVFTDFTTGLLPLYHPAAALYNPSQKSVLKDDFQVIKSYLPVDMQSTATTSTPAEGTVSHSSETTHSSPNPNGALL